MVKPVSVVCKEYNNNVDGVSTTLVKDLTIENGGEVVTGNEGFDFLNEALYKVDKAFENSIKSVMGFFQTTNIFIEDVIEYRTKTPSVTRLHELRPELIKYIGRIKFRRIEDRKAPVILGMRVNYNQLKDILEANSSYAKGITSTMERFEFFIDNLLDSNKNALNVQVDKDEVQALHNDVVKINKALDEVTGSKVMKDRVELGKLTKGLKELKETIDKTLMLGSVYRMENLEALYERNAEINSKLDLLYTAVKNKDATLSKDDIRKISDYIGSMAKMLTAVAFLYYLYYQLVDMLVAAVRIVELEDNDDGVVNKVAMVFKDSYKALMDVFK